MPSRCLKSDRSGCGRPRGRLLSPGVHDDLAPREGRCRGFELMLDVPLTPLPLMGTFHPSCTLGREVGSVHVSTGEQF